MKLAVTKPYKSTRKAKVRGKELRYSKPLNVLLSCNSQGMNNVCDLILDEMIAAGVIRNQERYVDKYRKHIPLILLNLYKAYSIDSKMYVAYSRGREAYFNGIYKDTSLSHIIVSKITDYLSGKGYIENAKGYYLTERNDGFKSRILAIRLYM